MKGELGVVCEGSEEEEEEEEEGAEVSSRVKSRIRVNVLSHSFRVTASEALRERMREERDE